MKTIPETELPYSKNIPTPTPDVGFANWLQIKLNRIGNCKHTRLS